jgi:hypothetical protein
MPPHCDSLDGPVVKAAIKALDEGNVDLVLPFVKEVDEGEIRTAFMRSMDARAAGPEARAVADLYFFETVVRIHRRGENAPYEGLKPVGLDVGPAIQLAEEAIETGSPDELVRLLSDVLHGEVKRRLEHVLALRPTRGASVPEGREYVEAMLGFQMWSNMALKTLRSDPHTQTEQHEG